MGKKSNIRNASSISDALLNKIYFAKNPQRKTNLREMRDDRVAWLRKKFPTNPSAQALAKKLEACSSKNRCRSLACPMCSDAARRLFVRLAADRLKGVSNDRDRGERK